ncbi:unnamed protein product [Paramecium sonneborni]|uniref:Uncharacterized protein n=1 Tax=Paramecium sonneborni TaxID=65129 RepID=A0A8S1R783_9CILI|nr:unnamed protein product [Paramecium sonneborni]
MQPVILYQHIIKAIFKIKNLTVLYSRVGVFIIQKKGLDKIKKVV